MTEYTYDPFGLTTASGAASSNPFQYTGRESEGDGLQFNRARYYSPATARFISADPAGMAGSGVDLYQYAESDPVDEVNPMGLESWLEGVGNGITGAVDTATGGLTGDIRGWAGLAQPNMSSASYQIGSDAGLLAATLSGDEEAAALDVAEDTADEAAEEATDATGETAGAEGTPPGKITGYTDHGLNQAISRDEHGVSPESILNTVRDPSHADLQDNGRWKLTGNNSVVILEQDGTLVTTYATDSSGWRW